MGAGKVTVFVKWQYILKLFQNAVLRDNAMGPYLRLKLLRKSFEYCFSLAKISGFFKFCSKQQYYTEILLYIVIHVITLISNFPHYS